MGLGLTLAVADADGHRLTLSRALISNAVKIGIPWQLGHVVANEVGALAHRIAPRRCGR
jgi:hypothetical protein